MPHPFIDFLQLSRPLPEADQALILDAFEEKTFREGDYLFRGGRICHRLFFVCKGVLRIVNTGGNGNEVTHFFLKENQCCTIMNSFSHDVPADERIQAACDAEVLSIGKPALQELYRQLPYLQEVFECIIRQALLDKINLRNAYLGLPSAERCQLFLKRQPEVALRVSLGSVASYLGITPQSLSRIRKNMH